MNTSVKIEQAATTLLQQRINNPCFSGLPEEQRPQSIDEALAIQQAMIKQLKAPIGWKCLLPPGDDKVVVAPILSAALQSGEVCELYFNEEDNEKPARIETEIAFVLGQDLPARDEPYSDAEIEQAIAATHLALELIQDRFSADRDVSFYEKLADGLCNQGLYLGPQIDKSQAFTLSGVPVIVAQGDNVQTYEGKHPCGLPQAPVFWLVNYMRERGFGFKAGEIIISGAYCGVVNVAFDELTTINFGEFSPYDVTFKQA